MIITNVKAVRSMSAMSLIVTNDNSSVTTIPSSSCNAAFDWDGLNNYVTLYGQHSIERISCLRDLYQIYPVLSPSLLSSRTEVSFRFTILSWWCDTPLSNEPSSVSHQLRKEGGSSDAICTELRVFGIDCHRTGVLLTYSVPLEICRANHLPWLVARGQVYVESGCLSAIDDVNDIVSFQRSDRTTFVSVSTEACRRPRGKTAGPISTGGVSTDPDTLPTVLTRRLHDFRSSIPKPFKKPRLDLVASSMQIESHRKTVRFRSLMRPIDTPTAHPGPVSSESRTDTGIGCFETPSSSIPDLNNAHARPDDEIDDYAVKTLFPSVTPAPDRRRVEAYHQWSAPRKEDEYSTEAMDQLSSLCSLSWVLDHELLRYQGLKDSSKCFSTGSGASEQLERCDRVFMRSAMVQILQSDRIQATEDLVGACTDLGTIDPLLIGDMLLLLLTDPSSHLKRYAVVDPELFRLMTRNNCYGHVDYSNNTSIIGVSSLDRRWEDSRWNVALSRCAAMRSVGATVLKTAPYEGLTSGDADAAHLSWRLVWMDRAAL